MSEDLTCRYCGEGVYRDIIDPGRDRHALHNEGFGSFGNAGGRGWRILECDRCQNLQFFRLTLAESERRGW